MEYQDQASEGQTSEINAPSLVKYATLPGSGRCRGPRCEGKVGYLDATQQEGDSQAPRRSNAVGSAMLSILFCSGLLDCNVVSFRFALPTVSSLVLPGLQSQLPLQSQLQSDKAGAEETALNQAQD